jgi:hypothetical protein
MLMRCSIEIDGESVVWWYAELPLSRFLPESGGGGLALSVPFFVSDSQDVPYPVAKHNTLALAAFSAVQSSNNYASCTASVLRMAAVHPHLPRGWAVRVAVGHCWSTSRASTFVCA